MLLAVFMLGCASSSSSVNSSPKPASNSAAKPQNSASQNKTAPKAKTNQPATKAQPTNKGPWKAEGWGKASPIADSTDHLAGEVINGYTIYNGIGPKGTCRVILQNRGSQLAFIAFNTHWVTTAEAGYYCDMWAKPGKYTFEARNIDGTKVYCKFTLEFVEAKVATYRITP
ncbi:hypothetical protein PLCT2_02738 [Planctomycetaceae bacterium]|nr:hypothetical protein PLCT2_02738 [Planctomycetaceae bacterium]